MVSGRILGRKSRADRRAQQATCEHRHRTKTPQRHQLVSCRDTQLKFFELKRRSPVALPPIAPRSVIPGVLVLARPSAREDGTPKTKTSPNFPQGNPGETAGTQGRPPRQTPGSHGKRQCRTTGLMRSEQPHESRTCRLRKSLSLSSRASCRTRSRPACASCSTPGSISTIRRFRRNRSPKRSAWPTSWCRPSPT